MIYLEWNDEVEEEERQSFIIGTVLKDEIIGSI